MRTLLALLILSPMLLSGCTVQDETLILAFLQPDDAVAPSEDPQRLADALAAATGRPVELYYVDSVEIALQAVESRQADAAFVDGTAGWFGWQRLGLEVAAAALDDGRPYYEAVAWVRANSTFTTMADLEGADSCHTGLLKSAGTFMPLGWLMRNGLVERVGPDELSSIEPTLDAFFGTVGMPGSDAEPYGGYQGALRCLSEGAGDVAFGKDTTPATYCDDAPASWCLNLDEYRELANLGRVPSHPVMVDPQLDPVKKTDLVDALVALGASEDGSAVLKDVLGSAGFVAVGGSQEHLGDYAANLEHVPGMSEYVDAQVR